MSLTATTGGVVREGLLRAAADPAWHVEIDRCTPDEWSQMLDLFVDANIYQTWSYGRVRWGDENLSHIVLKRGAEVVGLAQLRIVKPTKFDFGMAYLRWGPLYERRKHPLDPATASYMARVLSQEYVAKRGLFLRIMPNALAGSQRAAVFRSAFPGYRAEAPGADNTYRTLLLDLSPPLEELRRRLDKKWRNLLTSSEKKNLTVVAGTGVDEYRTFCSIYREMRKRKSFETTVDIEEFGRIQQNLPYSHRMRVLLCLDRGTPVAGVVASAMGDTGIYLLGATSDSGLNSRGAYLLQWTLIRWLKESGFRWYDLGGIDPSGNPGVFHFKRGLCANDVTQITPVTTCTNLMSLLAVRAGFAVRDTLRSCKGLLQLAHLPGTQTAKA